LFSTAASTIPQTISLRAAEPAKLNTQLAWEKELLGLYVSGHPYQKIHEFLDGTLMHMKDLPAQKDGSFVYAGGIILLPKTIVTKKGDPMAFIGLEDMTGKQEVIVFPKTFATVKDVMVEGQICLVSAKVSKREGEEAKLLANSFMIVSEENMSVILEMLKKEQWLAYPDLVTGNGGKGGEGGKEILEKKKETLNIKLQGKPTPEMVDAVRSLLQSKPGATPVCLLVESGGSLRRIETEYRVSPTESLVRELSSIVGAQNVELEK
jgi:DNA polymerase-3 subunit alpha